MSPTSYLTAPPRGVPATLSATSGVDQPDREAAVDLGAHHLAVGGGVVEAAEESAAQVLAGLLETFDLRVEEREALCGDRLPLLHVARLEDAGDVVEREPCVLEHADEDEP